MKMNEDAKEALKYILQTELEDFLEFVAIDDPMGLTEDEVEDLYNIPDNSQEFSKLIEKACNGGSMHIYARAYRGLHS